MVRKGSSVRVRQRALPICRHFVGERLLVVRRWRNVGATPPAAQPCRQGAGVEDVDVAVHLVGGEVALDDALAADDRIEAGGRDDLAVEDDGGHGTILNESCQLSAVSYQLSAISYQLSAKA